MEKAQSEEQKKVLAKAVLNVAVQLDISQSQLATVIGVSRTSISRLKVKLRLDAHSKQGELALLLISIYKSLNILSGGEVKLMRLFMNSPNSVTGGIPIHQINTISGLVHVSQQVSALRLRS